MRIKRSIRHILHIRKASGKPGNGAKTPEKPVSIRLRVSFNGKSVDFSTGLQVLPSLWDSVAQRIMPGSDCTDIGAVEEENRILADEKNTMEEIFARFELIEKRIPEAGEVKDLYNDMMGKPKIKVPSPETDLFAVFDKFIESNGRKNQWSKATFRKFEVIKGKLHDFDPTLTFRCVDDEKMESFLAYLNKKRMRNTTIAKTISFVKWFFRWASMKGYYAGSVHQSFKPRLKGINGDGKEIIYLTPDEVRKLEEWNVPEGKSYLGRVRDVFLFCCFTGLRHSDVAKLTRADVKEGYIDIVTQKTVDGIRIELNKHSQAILDKYKESTDIKGGKALPVVSNQKMNDYLKELGEACGIDAPTKIVYFLGNERHEEVYPKYSLLSTHCGRRTFVVNALRLGIPAEVIIRWTGHADYKSMKPYIKIVDELKQREMEKFNNF